MYRVLIVDDDVLVRTNVKFMLDCEALGLEPIIDVPNGKEALAVIDSLEPDIIITDIMMPELRGDELTAIIAKLYSHIKVIVISNYDEFEYVRCTLQNGAIEYVLKHQLNKQTLEAVIKRAIESIENETKQYYKIVDKPTNSNLIALKKIYITELLSGFHKELKEIESHIKILGVPLGLTNVLPFIVLVDDFDLMQQQRTLNNMNLLSFSITNILDEILCELGNGVATHISNERYVVILSFSNIRSEAKIKNEIDEIIMRISRSLEKYLGITVSVCIGQLIKDIRSISSSYEVAEKSLKNKFYYDKKSLIQLDEKTVYNETLLGLSAKQEKEFIYAIKSGGKKKIVELLDDLFLHIRNDSLSVTSAQIIFIDLLSILKKTCRDMNCDISEIYEQSHFINKLFSEFSTIDHAQIWFSKAMLKLAEKNTNDKITYKSQYVKETIEYLMANYKKDISLQLVAEKIGISSVYLSSLFRKEMGTGFSDYLLNIRIDKAKIELDKGDMSIKEMIKNCGFNDYVYFFKVFKKKVGMTPKNYIKRNS